MNTKGKIIELLQRTKRKGMDKMIEYMMAEGFFESPASTKFRGCYAGGLADHSLRVYELLSNNINGRYSAGKTLDLDTVSSPGQKPLQITKETVVIAPLLHDVCKIGAYIGNENPYKWNKSQPKGHALLSIKRIKEYIKLTDIEELMISYHMGVYGLREFYERDSWEYKTNAEYPLRGDHSNDKDLTKEQSQAMRYGKSMRNAWYHNPIVKLMYFCDEIATLEAKAEE